MSDDEFDDITTEIYNRVINLAEEYAKNLQDSLKPMDFTSKHFPERKISNKRRRD